MKTRIISHDVVRRNLSKDVINSEVFDPQVFVQPFFTVKRIISFYLSESKELMEFLKWQLK